MLSFSDVAVMICSVALFIHLYPWPGRKLAHIPTVGYSSQILSFIGGFEFLFKARHLAQRGCDQEGVFKIPNLTRWTVVVTGEKYIEEFRRTPENVLSFHEAVDETLQTALTLGPTISSDPYHIPVVRTLLTRNLPTFFPALYEEVVGAFDASIPAGKDDWTKVKALSTIMPIVSRASNLVLVGAPTCRNEEYMDINIKFTVTVTVAAAVLNILPGFLRPLASSFLGIDSMINRCIKHVQPLIEERRQNMVEHGKEYPGKPNDMLGWLMDAASNEEATIPMLTRRILTVNMAAIHTSSMTFTQALFDLATHPECIQEMRDEVEAITEREGWTHEALNQMVKIDSFMKESQRLNSLGYFTMERVARQPFTFSDGTVIPAGTYLAVAAQAAHTNEDSYTDPYTFRPFRFVEKRETTGRKVDMVSTHSDFVAFGYGLHACPGRFFAANELKLMMAHVVMTYDVKMEGGAGRPENMWYFTTCVPNPKAEVLFKRREN